MKVTHIKLSFSNAYLITDRKSILVDAGMPGEEEKIIRAAAQAGVRMEDVALILHTHGHVDHADEGSSRRDGGMVQKPPGKTLTHSGMYHHAYQKYSPGFCRGCRFAGGRITCLPPKCPRP